MKWPRALVWLGHEFLEMLPAVVFFAVGFTVIVLTTNLFLSSYSSSVGNFLVAITMALVVGKAVLVANATPFLRRYDTRPLVWSILYKAVVYCVFVFLARVIEVVLENWFHGRPFSATIATFSWDRFFAIQIWLFVLFLIYVTFSEMTQLFGEGELRRILFNHRSAELTRGRRERTQTLVQLSRLTASHTPEELAGVSPAHAELLQLLRGLAKG
jgi:uncharacterized membrane protein YidH (DUF202 family)